MALPSFQVDRDDSRLQKALLVQKADGIDADALEALAHWSRADPTEVEL